MSHPKSDLAASVQTEITRNIAHYHRWWGIWRVTASCVTILSILTSFAAGICAATRSVENAFWAAVLASFPALLLTFDQNFQFRARSDWFWNIGLHYQALKRALERGEMTDEEASRKIDDIEDRANANRPTVTKSPTAPKAGKG